MPIRPIKKKTIADSVVEQIKDMIIKGELKPGDRLDSERKLAEKFEIGRPSIREALKILTSTGLIKITNSGTFVSSNVLETVQDPLLFNLLINRSDYYDIYEARKIIESEAIKLAIDRINEKQLSKLRTDVMELARENIEMELFAKLDIEFHKTIVEASNNKVLVIFFSTIRDLQEEITKKILQKEGVQELAIDYHQKIYEAIMHGDKQQAKKHLIRHLEIAEEKAIDVLDEE